MFDLIPTTQTITCFKAKNGITGRYWNGKGFATPLFERGVTLTETELLVLRHTYENVVVESYETEERI